MTTFDLDNIDTLLHEYIDALNDRSEGKYDFGFEIGSKYIRIYQESGSQRSVHAFLDRATGDVIKPAGWKAPQRGKDGLAVRYRLADPRDKQHCFDSIDPHGSYLYV